MSTAAGPPSSHNDKDDHRAGQRTERVPPAPASRTTPTSAGQNHAPPDTREVVAAQAERFGGIKPGSAFFGWLTAAGMVVILTALATAAGAVVGAVTNTTVDTAVNSATGAKSTTATIVGAIILAVIVLIAYYCGGYVAGRMARFNGAKQGLAVWLWAILIAGIIALLAAIAGSKYDVFSQLNAFPRIPLSSGNLTTGGLLALALAAVVSLIGAVLGGLAGMRYHRRIDDATPDLAEQVDSF